MASFSSSLFPISFPSILIKSFKPNFVLGTLVSMVMEPGKLSSMPRILNTTKLLPAGMWSITIPRSIFLAFKNSLSSVKTHQLPLHSFVPLELFCRFQRNLVQRNNPEILEFVQALGDFHRLERTHDQRNLARDRLFPQFAFPRIVEAYDERNFAFAHQLAPVVRVRVDFQPGVRILVHQEPFPLSAIADENALAETHSSRKQSLSKRFLEIVGNSHGFASRLHFRAHDGIHFRKAVEGKDRHFHAVILAFRDFWKPFESHHARLYFRRNFGNGHSNGLAYEGNGARSARIHFQNERLVGFNHNLNVAKPIDCIASAIFLEYSMAFA